MKNFLVVVFALTTSTLAWSLPYCAGHVRFDNEAPAREDRIVEDFIVSAQDAPFGMAWMSITRVFGEGPALESLRYEKCSTPFPEGSTIETICKLPQVDASKFKHFPAYLAVVRSGDHTQEGWASVYFLSKPILAGKPIASIYCAY